MLLRLSYRLTGGPVSRIFSDYNDLHPPKKKFIVHLCTHEFTPHLILIWITYTPVVYWSTYCVLNSPSIEIALCVA